MIMSTTPTLTNKLRMQKIITYLYASYLLCGYVFWTRSPCTHPRHFHAQSSVAHRINAICTWKQVKESLRSVRGSTQNVVDDECPGATKQIGVESSVISAEQNQSSEARPSNLCQMNFTSTAHCHVSARFPHLHMLWWSVFLEWSNSLYSPEAVVVNFVALTQWKLFWNRFS